MKMSSMAGFTSQATAPSMAATSRASREPTTSIGPCGLT